MEVGDSQVLVKGGCTLWGSWGSGEGWWACPLRPLGAARARAEDAGGAQGVGGQLEDRGEWLGLGYGCENGEKWLNSGHVWKVESTLADQPDVGFGRKRGEGNARCVEPEPREAAVSLLRRRLHCGSPGRDEQFDPGRVRLEEPTGDPRGGQAVGSGVRSWEVETGVTGGGWSLGPDDVGAGRVNTCVCPRVPACAWTDAGGW